MKIFSQIKLIPFSMLYDTYRPLRRFLKPFFRFPDDGIQFLLFLLQFLDYELLVHRDILPFLLLCRQITAPSPAVHRPFAGDKFSYFVVTAKKMRFCWLLDALFGKQNFQVGEKYMNLWLFSRWDFFLLSIFSFFVFKRDRNRGQNRHGSTIQCNFSHLAPGQWCSLK